MTYSTNNELTLSEAQKLIASKGMAYPKTDHNKKMIGMATRMFITKLHNVRK